jgi:hypothetical protein
MKQVLLISATCLLTASILLSQTEKESAEHYFGELTLPDSTLKKFFESPDKIDSLISGKIIQDSMPLYSNLELNNLLQRRSTYGDHRNHNMPEYRVKEGFSLKMPEYKADSGITYIMPEVKFPELISDESKIPEYLEKPEWEK